jgi:nucleoside-diphosphate-sugar epimerase
MERTKTVLVTGGAGFVGLHLTRRLLQTTPHRVVILDNFMRGARDLAFRELMSTHADRLAVCETFPVEDVHVIYHLAALNGTRYFYERPYELLRNNVLVTLELLDRYKDKSVKILYSSSGEVYADTEPQIPTAESTAVGFKDVFNPRWSYAYSKLFGELALINAARGNPDLKYVIFRLHNVYGPRMGYEHVVPAFLKRMLAGEDPMVIKNPDDTRSFSYIDDVVDAVLLLAESPRAEGQIVHVGNPEEISVWDLARTMAEAFYDPHKLRRGEKQDVGSASRRRPDIRKLQELTGWKPQVSLADGLRRTYEFYQADLLRT